ncbi:phenylpropionate dioxygenase-like ring-hydroxylating dioxygenase large terminal subunit [Methylobacterium sp. PvP062]|uniref:Vanillate O-demethylase monooxygenase subunit n=1 Tax=Methylobacterium radiotolerans TaxID=31998 RepID=A0ABV2NTT6_9HYPH|nr:MULTISPECIES: aromatic ring-hydroxylating dioxygenase subunit alpha [unclassified Methylobacterium]MBP2498291.1 vanillate O-demethylase monooxygenase subunit [Methylobacterium sp. PvP105]MBP2505675.1 vanillate O-demethylase monooxygenase subunit [Methylobacterium sp. PvP109]
MYAPAAIPDFKALRHCWHPVAFTNEVTDKPYATRLLDEQIVVWRDSKGAVHAMADLCIHRGTALSIGKVVGDEIMCPYHGWRYGKDGACTLIPQRENPRNVPSKARVAAYNTQERYGLIWVAMDEPRWALPEIPEMEDEEYNKVSAGPYPWKADSSRQVENFTDFGHFPWVHAGLLGDPDRVVVDKYNVEVRGHVLHYTYDRPEVNNTDDFPVFGGEAQRNAPIRHSRYELQVPYTIILRHNWGGREQMVHIFTSQPIDREHSRGFIRTARNYAHDQDPKVMVDFNDVIFDQDKFIVETQRPEHVPFDLADELHLDFDKVAVNYRKTMRETGLAMKNPDGAKDSIAA